MEKTLFLALLLLAIASSQKDKGSKIKLELPKIIDNEFSGGGSVLSGGGRINGLSLTGTWRPRNTGNSFTGTGSWQNGQVFRGSVSGTFGFGGGTSINLGLGGGGGKGLQANAGITIKFRRKRRSDLVRTMFDLH